MREWGGTSVSGFVAYYSVILDISKPVSNFLCYRRSFPMLNRFFASKVFLRNGELNESELALWLTLLLKTHPPKTQAYVFFFVEQRAMKPPATEYCSKNVYDLSFRTCRRYFLYVIFGPLGMRADGTRTIRWAEMGESTPSSSEVADDWFRPLAKALRALYKANHAWTSR